MEGVYTKKDVEVFNRLLVEANNQLNIIKIPSSYQKYASYIKGLNINLIETAHQMSLDNLIAEMTKLEKIKVIGESEDKVTLAGLDSDSPNGEPITKKLTHMIINELEEKPEVTTDDQETIIPEDPKNEELKKVYSVILGDEELPEDLKKKSSEELEELGGEVITEFDVQAFADGRLEMEELPEEKREQLAKILELMKNEPKDIDEFSDPDEK